MAPPIQTPTPEFGACRRHPPTPSAIPLLPPMSAPAPTTIHTAARSLPPPPTHTASHTLAAPMSAPTPRHLIHRIQHHTQHHMHIAPRSTHHSATSDQSWLARMHRAFARPAAAVHGEWRAPSQKRSRKWFRRRRQPAARHRRRANLPRKLARSWSSGTKPVVGLLSEGNCRGGARTSRSSASCRRRSAGGATGRRM